jgi:hypothetical protein
MENSMSNPEAAMMAGAMVGMMVMLVVEVIFYLFYMLCVMFVAKKLKVQNAWLAFIPIANIYLMTQMAGREWWWTLLCLIPFVGFIFAIILWVDILKKLGKNPWMVLVLIFFGFVYLPILAFSKN